MILYCTNIILCYDSTITNTIQYYTITVTLTVTFTISISITITFTIKNTITITITITITAAILYYQRYRCTGWCGAVCVAMAWHRMA